MAVILVEPPAVLFYNLQIRFPVVQRVTIEMYYNLILLRLHQEVFQINGFAVNRGAGIFFVRVSMVTHKVDSGGNAISEIRALFWYVKRCK